MPRVEETILVLLAAGRSCRFGTANKLEQDFLGKPVGFHVVTALEAIPFRSRIVVQDDCVLDFAAHGYDVVRNDEVARGMAWSLHLGVSAAQAGGAEAVLVALADMPRVTAAHVYRLFDSAEGSDTVVMSSDGHRPMPPGLFGKDRFDFLKTLTGDKGARDLVRGGRHVVASPAELIDIDTPEDLERLRALTRGGARRSG